MQYVLLTALINLVCCNCHAAEFASVDGLTIYASKEWKCPFCHRFADQGQKCQNSRCPGKN